MKKKSSYNNCKQSSPQLVACVMLPLVLLLGLSCYAQVLMPTEQLYLTTVRLDTWFRNGSGWSSAFGTGFFFQPTDDPRSYWIVTNKHVLVHKKLGLLDHLDCIFHESSTSLRTADLLGTKKLSYAPPPAGSPGSPLFHDEKCVDLAAVPFERPFGGPGWSIIPNEGGSSSRIPEFKSLSVAHILSNDKLFEKVVGVDRALMYGYPHYVFDAYHKLPIARVGHLASLAFVDYSPSFTHELCDDVPTFPSAMGILDVACFPGSSGSPVVIADGGNLRQTRDGNSEFGVPRLVLLGVAFGTIFRKVTNQIKNIPTTGDVEEDLHVAFYWKATEILKLRASPPSVTANQALATARKDVNSS